LSSKFEEFVFDPRLRRIFGQRRSTIDLREIMDCAKILLVNLAKGADLKSKFTLSRDGATKRGRQIPALLAEVERVFSPA
jgi:hypothetical protein